eukprot:6709480-Ditylum_brightwellii.AAC.2
MNFSNGSYLDFKPTKVVSKYKAESNFLFGVATAKLQSGKVVRKHLQPFCCTGQKILSHRDWEKQISVDIAAVKREGTKKCGVRKFSMQKDKCGRKKVC